MAEKVRTLGPGTLIIGATDAEQRFDADTTKVTLTPKTDTDDAVDYLDGSSESGAQSVSYTIDGTVKEDYSTTGIQAWCFNNQGKTFPFKYIPNNQGQLGFTGDVLIAPIAIGGDVKKKNDQDFSFTATNVKLTPNTPGE